MNKENRPPQKRTIIGLLRKIFQEIVKQKRWALLPLFILLAAIALILIFAGSSYLLPAIYIAI